MTENPGNLESCIKIMQLMFFFLLNRVKINDISQLKPLIGKARLARCRSRFVVPVISFNGKVSLSLLLISSPPAILQALSFSVIIMIILSFIRRTFVALQLYQVLLK